MFMKRHKILFAIVVIVLLTIAWKNIAQPGVPLFSNAATEKNGWNLILVNQKNYLPSNYNVELLELSNGEKIDKRIYPELQKMFDMARKSGIDLEVASGYRTFRDQQVILDEKTERYEELGENHRKAENDALKLVAKPGTSEHQTGLAVDIDAKGNTDSSILYTWLSQNAYRYGFIQRYPGAKKDITGISNEPWHYRYVGTNAAKKIFERRLCLEEYLKDI